MNSLRYELSLNVLCSFGILVQYMQMKFIFKSNYDPLNPDIALTANLEFLDLDVSQSLKLRHNYFLKTPIVISTPFQVDFKYISNLCRPQQFSLLILYALTLNCDSTAECTPRPVYLSFGSYGLLYIEYNGENGTVCGDHFNETECDVVCRQLGYG